MFDWDLPAVIAGCRLGRADDRSASAVLAWEWRPAALRPALLSEDRRVLPEVPRNRQEPQQWRKEQPATRISFGNFSHNKTQKSQRNIFSSLFTYSRRKTISRSARFLVQSRDHFAHQIRNQKKQSERAVANVLTDRGSDLAKLPCN